MSTIHNFVERTLALQPLLERRAMARSLSGCVQCGYRDLTSGEILPSSASVLNISARGLGLDLAGPVELGAVLAIDLRAADRRGFVTTLLRVAHAAPSDVGRWLVGGPVAQKFSAEDLRHFGV